MRATSRSVRVPESTTGSTTLSLPRNASPGNAGVLSSTSTPGFRSFAKRSGAVNGLALVEGKIHPARVQLAHDFDVLVGLDVSEGAELVAHNSRMDLCDLDRHGRHGEAGAGPAGLLAAG